MSLPRAAVHWDEVAPRRPCTPEPEAASASPPVDMDSLLQRMPACLPGSMAQWLCNVRPELLELCEFRFGHQILSTIRGYLHDAEDFIAKHRLTEDEVVAWALWTVDAPNLYGRMCRLMREGDTDALAEYHTWLWWLMQGAPKLPDHTGVVYRVHQGKANDPVYAPKKDVHFAAFTSCSTQITPGQLATFGSDNGMLMALHVQSHCAKRLGPLSIYPEENEIVLLPGWQGTVKRWLNEPQRKQLQGIMRIKETLFHVVEVYQGGLSDCSLSLVDECQRQEESQLGKPLKNCIEPRSPVVHVVACNGQQHHASRRSFSERV